MSKEITTTGHQGFMAVTNLKEAWEIAEIISKSPLCPKAFQGKPGDVLVCLQFGQEVGLAPLQSLHSIGVINGKPALYGDGALSVCRIRHDWEYMQETFDDVTMTATCIVKRRGEPECIRNFSKSDAQTAGLWGSTLPWKNYPKRMLQMRSRGFALRDTFADALRGLITENEAKDYPAEERRINSKVSTTIVEGQVEHPKYITDAQLALIKEHMEATKTDADAMCAHYKIAAIELLPAESFANVMAALAKKEARMEHEERMARKEAWPDAEAENPIVDAEVTEFFGDEE